MSVANAPTLRGGTRYDVTRIANRYELRSPLGSGGMGVVWCAHDLRLGREVALKILLPDSVGDTPARARLLQEARAAAALDHPGVVRVYDADELDDGGAFLVMERVRGKTLTELVEARAIDVLGCVDVVIQVARALAFAHDAGVVHRDVKPANIMVRPDGRAAVLDFGIAAPVPSAFATTMKNVGARLTREGEIVGTPAYLSPEQARGRAIGPASDQFSLAVTAYRVLTGRHPWDAETIPDLLASMLRDDAPPMGASSLGLPAELDGVIARALAKAPGDRFTSMSEFADALEAVTFGLGAPLRRRGASAQVSGARAIPPERNEGARGLVRPLAAIAFSVVAVLVGGAALVNRGAGRLPGSSFTLARPNALLGLAGRLPEAVEAGVPRRTRLHVRAYVDGTSRLVIRDDRVFWRHVRWSAPGRWRGADEPTLLDGRRWTPTWPDQNLGRENLDCVCESSSTALDAPLDLRGDVARVRLVDGRDSVAIVTQPGDGRGELVLEIIDRPEGAEWYEFEIDYPTTGGTQP